MKLRFLAIASIAVLTPATALGGAAPSRGDSPAEIVKVADYYYSPPKVRVGSGDVVAWKWSKANFDTHNVTLTTAPDGVRKKDFRSDSGSTGVKFAPVFKKVGTYEFVCRFHPTQMMMSVNVKR